MVRLTKTQSRRRLTIRLAACVIMSSGFALTALGGTAAAEDRQYEHRDQREYRHNWNGGY